MGRHFREIKETGTYHSIQKENDEQLVSKVVNAVSYNAMPPSKRLVVPEKKDSVLCANVGPTSYRDI